MVQQICKMAENLDGSVEPILLQIVREQERVTAELPDGSILTELVKQEINNAYLESIIKISENQLMKPSNLIAEALIFIAERNHLEKYEIREILKYSMDSQDLEV